MAFMTPSGVRRNHRCLLMSVLFGLLPGTFRRLREVSGDPQPTTSGSCEQEGGTIPIRFTKRDLQKAHRHGKI